MPADPFEGRRHALRLANRIEIIIAQTVISATERPK